MVTHGRNQRCGGRAAQLAATRPEVPLNPFLRLQAASAGTQVERSDKWSCANVFGG